MHAFPELTYETLPRDPLFLPFPHLMAGSTGAQGGGGFCSRTLGKGFTNFFLKGTIASILGSVGPDAKSRILCVYF